MAHDPQPTVGTVRLTVGQAVVRFLAQQWTERDGERRRFFAGCLGILGHGNLAGLGQALLQDELAATSDASAIPDASAVPDASEHLRYVLARNEQAMVHTAVGYARQQDRLQTWACTASVGPGSTNMLTGAALATVNRIPVLLLPSGTFATRVSAPVLQELEVPQAGDVSVNDAFRPLSRFFDQVERPEQLPSALLGAMRVLTDPADTGAATIALPQDVQAQAHDWPVELFTRRIWRIARPVPEALDVQEAAAVIRSAARPLIVAGGGVHHSGAEEALRALCDATGIPVGESQAGKGSLPHGHPRLVGAVGATGTTAANALAAEADVVIGVGTRWADFTTASRTAFQHSGVRFVNVNVARFDAGKHAGLPVVADAREALRALTDALQGWSVDDAYRARQEELWRGWDASVEQAFHPPSEVTDALAEGLLTQAQVIGILNEESGPRDVVVCAAGSMPGDLHKLWRVRDRKGYHVEYGYSCMGYEIPAAIGVRLADPSREVFAMVGDGGYLMMPTELVTAVQERVKIVVVLVQNHGFHSIGALSESVGSQRFGTRYRYRDASGRLGGDVLPVDLAANARSLGAHVIEVRSVEQLRAAVAEARARPADSVPVVIHVETDPTVQAPDSASWWDVPVAEVSELEATQQARRAYVGHRAAQRPHLAPTRAPSLAPDASGTSVRERSPVPTPSPRHHRLTLGVCPDQWGVWFPEDERQIPWETALDEMAQAGFSVMETGPFGYFPTDPRRLQEAMDERGFRVVAGTGWGVLHRPEAWADTERTFRRIAETHAAVGAEYLVHLPPMFRDEKTWAYTDERVLSTQAWNTYVANADRLGRLLKQDYGLAMVLHPHGDSHIETPADIDRIFQATDPEYVGFCLDTGHVVYGGGDPVELCRSYPERISYVHIKAMDEALVRRAHEEDWPFGMAVAQGCSVAPPAGAPDMPSLVAALADLDKDLYVVCEQDMYPCDPALPLPNAIRTRRYLASLGLGEP